MTVGSGIGSSIGIGVETTYGTYAAPTRWVEYDKQSLAFDPKRVQGRGLAAGLLVERGSQRHTTTVQAKGDLACSVFQKGMGLLLAQAMGSSAVPVAQGASAAYLQTHDFGNDIGKSLTIQAGVPDLQGVVHPYNFVGCKIIDTKFECGIDELLKATFTIDAANAEETDALVAPTYTAANQEFHFAQGAVLMGDYGSEVAVAGVRKASIGIKRSEKTNRFYLGSATKAEPVVDNFAEITGTLDTDFIDKTKFVDLFAADTPISLLLTFTGPVIASTYPYEFTIHIPEIRFNGKPPEVSGPDIVMPAMDFVGRDDDTNPPITLTYQSTDTTL